MQRYGVFWLVPRKSQDSYRSCCDRVKDLRQGRGMRLDFVTKNKIIQEILGSYE